jgi:hypothetical protein
MSLISERGRKRIPSACIEQPGHYVHIYRINTSFAPIAGHIGVGNTAARGPIRGWRIARLHDSG